MKIINEEKVNACLTSIDVEVEMKDFVPFIDIAYKSAAKQISVPGFRKGKAPKSILKSYVDPKYLAEYATEKFVDKKFEDIIKLSEKTPYAQVSYDLVDCDVNSDAPVTIKFNIPTEPVVTLGEYKGIEVKKYEKTVSDEDIQKQLDEIVAQRTKIVPILDRPAQDGDTLFIDLKDNDDEEAKPKPQRYIIGKGVADMDEAITGMEQGDEKDAIISYPADYYDEDLKGKTINYHIKLRTIYANEEPEVNDDFIKELFKNAPESEETPKTLDEFKAYSKKHMQEELDRQFENMFTNELLNKIVENASIEYPEAMITERVNNRLKQFTNYLKQNKMNPEDYMKAYQLTPKMMYEEFKKQEDIELKRSLAGAEIIKAENITATEEEIENAVKEKAESMKSTPEAVKEMMDKNSYYKTMLEDEIVSKKFMDFIKENAKIAVETWDEEKMMAQQMAQQIENTAEKAEENKTEESAE